MKLNIKIAVISLVLIFTYAKVNALDCSFVLRPVTTASTCLANGKVVIEVEGEDLGNLSLDTAQYKIQELGGQGHSTGFATNGGIFNDLHTGNYVVTIRVFCKKNGVTVDKQTATFSITGNYVAPNMYIDVARTIKTLSCKKTGKLTAYFNYGKAPYHIKLLSSPPEYTGETEFTSPNTGFFEFGELAAGPYSIELKDDCGNTFITNGTIETLTSDFPNLVFDKTLKNGNDCKLLNVTYKDILTTSEIYHYWENLLTYYDVYLQEDGGDKKLRADAIKYNSSIHFSLEDFTFGDLYTAHTNLTGGGHEANLVFKVKDCDNYSQPYPITIKRPYHGISHKADCDGLIIRVQQYTDPDGLICYPYKTEIIDVNTNAVIVEKEGILDYRLVEIGKVPYGVTFIVKYTGADGAQWTTNRPSGINGPITQFNNDKIRYKASTKVNTFCQENGHTGFMILQNFNSIASSFIMVPGTSIKPLTVPVGMELSPDTIFMNENESYQYYPYGTSYAILPGEYTFEISNPCLGTNLDTVKVVFGSITAAYYTYIKQEICKASIGKSIGYLYINDGGYIPGGSTLKYLGSRVEGVPGGAENDDAVLHKNFIMPSNISRHINPFHPDFSNIIEYTTIPEGSYDFELHDAFCNQTKLLTISVGKPYHVENFGYTIDSTCDAAIVYPTGRIKRETTNINTYFKITSAVNEDGTVMPTNEYPTNYIVEGNSFTLQRNGYYKMAVQYNTNAETCFMDTVTIHHKQPRPSLNYALTASFVCENSAVGDLAFIKLVGVGGYGQGNGPYEYEIVGSNPIQKNNTGEFTYGKVNETLTIRITDQSAEAIAKNCVSYIEQNVTILDLKEANIAYSINNGNFCEGETILLNSVSLGNTQYFWDGPNGFTSNLQFPKLDNAAINMSGYYYITVIPENCGETLRDSVLITVFPNPTIPSLVSTDTFVCYNSGSYNLATMLGAVAAPGNKLKWYDKDGVTLTSPTINSISIVAQKYFVSQIVEATGCEGPLQEINIETKSLPLSPIAPSPSAVCFNDNVTICVTNAVSNYKYRLYSSSTGAVILQEKAGTASPTLCFDPIIYNNSSTTLYRYISTVNEFGCESKPRGTIIVNLKESGLATDIETPDTTICRGNSITLKAKAENISNPEFTWYNGTSATSVVLGTGDTYTTPDLTSSVYYYYVSVKGDGICENLPSGRKRVTVRTNPIAAAPTITSVTNTCIGKPVSVQASLNITNPVFSWYDSKTSTTPVFVGEVIQFPALYKDTLLYVGVSGNGYCETLPANRRSAKITVFGYEKLTVTSVNPTFGESNGSFTVDFGTNYNNIRYRLYGGSGWTSVTTNPLVFENLNERSVRLEISTTNASLNCSNVDTTFILKGLIKAIDDTITMFKNTTVNIPVSKNDSDPNRTKINDSISKNGTKGTAIVSSVKGNLEYTNAGNGGLDILEYKARSVYDTAAAKVLVYIINSPDIKLEDSCSFAPYMILNQEYSGSYKWEYSSDGVGWEDLSISTHICRNITPGKYRVTVKINDVSFTTNPKELILEKKSTISNKAWYQMSLN